MLKVGSFGEEYFHNLGWTGGREGGREGWRMEGERDRMEGGRERGMEGGRGGREIK